MGVNDASSITADNRERLHVLDGRIDDLEGGYKDIKQRLASDREVIVMMCHQYAYAEQVPEQCDFALTALKQPEDYRWHYPEEHEEKTILPPMAHK